MPKAQAFSEDEEKTTIESGWEEESSTTVNQDEVAEKIRSLAIETPLRANGGGHVNTNITSTNGGVFEESTVDDQRAQAALSMPTPAIAPARIVVTAGNDKGQELEIRPGKTYTIGRAIDNDFVLTDIAVSRKHFDLRHEGGTWIVADRGSGNGTVINGNIEDQPFSLMNGDAIEIGNTTFRFDHANQPARGARPSRTLDLDDEPSTVAEKPFHDDIPSSAQMPPRPKTVPPPPPRSVGKFPPGYTNGRPAPPVPSAAPIGQPLAPMQLGGPIGVPMASPTAPTVQPMHKMQAIRPQMLGDPMHGMQPLPGMMPTTIPGQGPPVAPSQPQVPGFSYPNVGDVKPQLGQLQIPNGTPRDATSTALVQPVPYGMAPNLGPASFGLAQPRPQLFTKRVKLLIGGALLMVLAAIATIAIIKSSSSDKKKTRESSVAPSETKKQPAKVPDKVVVADPQKDDKKLDLQKKLDEQAKLEEQKRLEEQKKLEEEQKKLADQKKLEELKKEEQKKLDDQKKVADEQRRAEEQKRLEAKRIEDQRKAEERKAEEQRRAEDRRAEQERRAEEARQRKLEAQRRADEARKKKQEQRPATTTKKPETSVASTPTVKRAVDTSEVKAKADGLYRGRKFKEAGQVLRSAAASLGEADARELRSTAAAYEQVGSAYNVGMGPATPPVDAYASLTKAMNLDRPFGVYTDELKAKLALVAPKAATKFMANKQYEQAFTAVRVAEANGGGNSTTQAIREGLVNAANDLYQQAMAEKGSNKDAARQKLQRIRGMVDGKASVLAKAEKALRDIPK